MVPRKDRRWTPTHFQIHIGWIPKEASFPQAFSAGKGPTLPAASGVSATLRMISHDFSLHTYRYRLGEIDQVELLGFKNSGNYITVTHAAAWTNSPFQLRDLSKSN